MEAGVEKAGTRMGVRHLLLSMKRGAIRGKCSEGGLWHGRKDGRVIGIIEVNTTMG